MTTDDLQLLHRIEPTEGLDSHHGERAHAAVRPALEGAALARLAESPTEREFVRRAGGCEGGSPGWVIRVNQGQLPVPPLEPHDHPVLGVGIETEQRSPLVRERRRSRDRSWVLGVGVARERGQGMVEYGIILGLVSVLAIGALTLLGTDITAMFAVVTDALAPLI